ncbi:hypothetical protein HYH02_000798 [Chlamydomonas schloesseri]|uniref:Uncharacterized protein n=1 Tax=Chlamydomonas schloesseri TaxID=2026947 RepID=A0A836BCZ9_9CHLO|nr:hypothetical protein HYH02_000798 [Chlamydomonas schloesseri]|eukprot:KAG2454972.1 hypothetical protein HYH02_000798 [Chlamydomonas schloesseri]
MASATASDDAAAAPGSCLMSLVFAESDGPSTSPAVAAAASAAEAAASSAPAKKKQKQQHALQIDRALLWHASPVLRGAIDAACSSSTGATELTLVGDDPAQWECVLQLLQHTASGVSWNDMAPVRTACAAFLAAKANSCMNLSYDLDMPYNTLHAASLLERYSGYTSAGVGGGSGGSAGGRGGGGGGGDGGIGGVQPNLQPHVDVVMSALNSQLGPLALRSAPRVRNEIASTARAAAAAVAKQLSVLTKHPHYRTIVSEGMQARVVATLVDGVNALLA